MKESQSKILADWLDGRASEMGLESDVCQTIWVFKPDLAPVPQVDVGQLLNHVTRGPFAQNSEPDSAGDSELEPLFDLNAQARPNLKVDAIFDSLTQGPLMSTTKTTVPDNVEPLFKRFRGPAFGGFLAVACALIVLLPTNFEVEIHEEDEETLPAGDVLKSSPPQVESKTNEEAVRLDYSQPNTDAPLESAEQAISPSPSKKKRISPKRKSKAMKPRGPQRSSKPLGTVDAERPAPQSKDSPTLGIRGSKKKGSGQIGVEAKSASQGKKRSGPSQESEWSMEPSIQTKRAAVDSPVQTDTSLDQTLTQRRRQAWSFGTIVNPLGEPLRSQVSQASTVAELFNLMGRGQTDDDLEIAFRIANLDSKNGEVALKTALRSTGGTTSLRRRAWAKLGDILVLKGERNAALKAYDRALSGP